MGRKATRTEEDKKQYNAEYYQKYKHLMTEDDIKYVDSVFEKFL